MFRVIIISSEKISNYFYLRKKLNYLLKNKTNDLEILVQEEMAITNSIKKYAKERKFRFRSVEANWKKYGKRAGYIRNENMFNEVDGVIIFWSKQNKQINHILNLCKERNIKVKIVDYYKEQKNIFNKDLQK